MANKKKSIYSHIHETRLSSYAYSRIYNIRKCKRKKKYCLHSEEMKLKHLHQRQLSTMANGKVSLTWTVKWNDDAYLIKCIFSLLFFFFWWDEVKLPCETGRSIRVAQPSIYFRIVFGRIWNWYCCWELTNPFISYVFLVCFCFWANSAPCGGSHSMKQISS